MWCCVVDICGSRIAGINQANNYGLSDPGVPLPSIAQSKHCIEWVDEATSYITRKQQNRPNPFALRACLREAPQAWLGDWPRILILTATPRLADFLSGTLSGSSTLWGTWHVGIRLRLGRLSPPVRGLLEK